MGLRSIFADVHQIHLGADPPPYFMEKHLAEMPLNAYSPPWPLSLAELPLSGIRTSLIACLYPGPDSIDFRSLVKERVAMPCPEDCKDQPAIRTKLM
jgi:hypothetical protein